MGYVTEIFGAALNQSMEKDATTLPVGQSAYADLALLLQEEGDYTYASLKSESTYETVKLSVVAGTLVVERAQEGTEAVKHPCGTMVCLVSPTTVAAIKALICEYDCCEETDCECEPVTVAGKWMPEATVNKEWNGAVVFTGTTPVTLAIKNQPEWMSAVAEGGVMTLSGTPTEAGEALFTVAASNCNGTAVTSMLLTLHINEGVVETF